VALRDNNPAMLVAAFGLHSSKYSNRHTDGVLFHPGLVQLAIIPLIPEELCGGCRLDPLHAAIRGVWGGQRDALATARHMDP
jgi:hypothetical protein